MKKPRAGGDQCFAILTPLFAAQLPLRPTQEIKGHVMAYEIKHGPEQRALTERPETATACLERVKALKAKQALDIKIYDRSGNEVTIAELEKRAEKEML